MRYGVGLWLMAAGQIPSLTESLRNRHQRRRSLKRQIEWLYAWAPPLLAFLRHHDRQVGEETVCGASAVDGDDLLDDLTGDPSPFQNLPDLVVVGAGLGGFSGASVLRLTVHGC